MRHKTFWSYILIPLLVSIFCTSQGCISHDMKLSPEQVSRVNPVGLYIIAAKDIKGSKNEPLRQIVLNSAEKSFLGYLGQKGYQAKPLNSTIPMNSVYINFGIWYVNEKKIAQAASKAQCRSVMIVHFYLPDSPFQTWDTFDGYQPYGVHAWLVEAPSGKLIDEIGYRFSYHNYSLKNPSAMNWLRTDRMKALSAYVHSFTKILLMNLPSVYGRAHW